ncbi:hypothetical protein HYALB_00013660 [Hymenoscyphus albidus]|uniref:Uncharacterized protein n=1 Tax=Hymenoscyphus albidus TaxID=595503 RepID=A0A9N9LUA5_9HELO|nr:hypothetical protein HYALB_00013660 [Hymenoscyphus albidus]
MFLFGCPAAQDLDWDENGLLGSFTAPFVRLARLPKSETEIDKEPSVSVIDIPQWRSFPLEPKHLKTGYTQGQCWLPEYQRASFFTPSDVGSILEELSQSGAQNTRRRSARHVDASVSSQQSKTEKRVTKKPRKVSGKGSVPDTNSQLGDIVSQFYEESYARHEEVPSSQLVSASSQASSSYSSSECYSFDTHSSIKFDRKEPPKSGLLSHLQDFPNAFEINSIRPQVITVNIIVGIISVSEPRTIRTKWGHNVELVEAIVGDETKSGFGVNFWISSSQSASLKESVGSLRPQDVLLIRHVALDTFMGKVYGQNARKGWTTVHLLYRNKVDRNDTSGYYTRSDFTAENPSNPQLAKTRSVREWVLRFVGGGWGRRRGLDNQDILPPDTQ